MKLSLIQILKCKDLLLVFVISDSNQSISSHVQISLPGPQEGNIIIIII